MFGYKSKTPQNNNAAADVSVQKPFNGQKTKTGLSRKIAAGVLSASFLAASVPGTADAAAGRGPTQAALLVDASNGRVLYERNADAEVYPASTTKLMTVYLTFEALQKGDLRLGQTLTVSRNAAGQAPTNLGMMTSSRRIVRYVKNKKGKRVPVYATTTSQGVTSITVENALRGMMTHSANDAAMVLGEALGNGSAANFATKMNAKAATLGMTHSHFTNPNGLPSPSQHTTARDMVTLMRAIQRDFPQYYRQFLSIRSFSFNGGSWRNTNHLLDSAAVPGVDGGKTGYIRASGFNIVFSAARNDKRVIGGVFGGSSGAARNALATNMINYGFVKMVNEPNASFDAARKYEIVTPPAPVIVTPPAVTQPIAPPTSSWMPGLSLWPSAVAPFNGAAPAQQAPQAPSAAPTADKQPLASLSYRMTYTARFG